MNEVADVSVPGEVAKSIYPAGYVVGVEFMGLTADGWITTLTLIYLICQLVLVMPRISKVIAKNYIAIHMLIKSKQKDE